MKTYKQHLITTQSFGEKLNLIKKPTFRSSAIFPIINNKFLETKIEKRPRIIWGYGDYYYKNYYHKSCDGHLIYPMLKKSNIRK